MWLIYCQILIIIFYVVSSETSTRSCRIVVFCVCNKSDSERSTDGTYTHGRREKKLFNNLKQPPWRTCRLERFPFRMQRNRQTSCANTLVVSVENTKQYSIKSSMNNKMGQFWDVYRVSIIILENSWISAFIFPSIIIPLTNVQRVGRFYFI